ncbi:2201_t:CDS:1 [Dentiscutata heterogama]|uniref:2201_t:CDS:1 n=1 Tax=Dentiscutata heterogama TaxID=1316150 RepID=A0ACA9KUA5_9GLOM|nr:2201_t:CDS:1 [Dentiscutata heterogama]
MDSDTLIIFKVTCSNEPAILRRITFTKIDDVSYQALYSNLSLLFEINDFKIRYIDEDKDAIAIDNDFDLQEAIKHNKSRSKGNSRLVIRLTLEVTSFPTDQGFSNHSHPDSIAQNFVTQFSDESLSIHRHNDNNTFLSIPRTSHIFTNSRQLNGSYHNAICDYCDSVIAGVRYKCINCPDFDLCNNCVALAPIQHPGHTFIPIHRNGEPEIKPSNSVFHPGIRCDACGKAIRGVRYKCGNCVDFDLCGNCEADPISKHDENHIFIKIKKPVLKRLRTNKPLLHHLYSEVDQKTSHGKYSRRSSQSRNIQSEMEFVSKQTLVESNSDESSLNRLNPLISPLNGEDNTSESVISRAPIALYNGPFFMASFNISPPTPENLTREKVQTPIATNTLDIPCSPSPSVTTIASQDEDDDIPMS